MTDYVQGIDVSHHQGAVDHAKVAASGMRFCIVKATEGTGYTDDRFAENIAEIRHVLASGEIYYPGAYHFARPDSVGTPADGRDEGEAFCDAVESACGSILNNFLPPALDFETYSSNQGPENIAWIEAWIEVIQRRLKRAPMIYTGKNVWGYELGNTSRFTSLPLWQVAYSATARRPPAMPWPEWTLWQWSGGGHFGYHGPVPGVVGAVDVNRFSGSLGDLEIFAAAAAQANMPPPPTVDLNTLRGQPSNTVGRVQGLLLAHGYGPDGLVTPTGQVDSMMGDKTESYLRDFKDKAGLGGDAVVDEATWLTLTYQGLP